MANSDEIRRKREAAKQRRMAGQALAALLASDVNAFGKLRQQRDLLAPFDDHELAQLKRLLQIAADALLGDPGGASWEAVNTALQQLPSPSTAERDTPSGAGPTPSAPSPAPSPVGPSPATPPSQPSQPALPQAHPSQPSQPLAPAPPGQPSQPALPQAHPSQPSQPGLPHAPSQPPAAVPPPPAAAAAIAGPPAQPQPLPASAAQASTPPPTPSSRALFDEDERTAAIALADPNAAPADDPTRPREVTMTFEQAGVAPGSGFDDDATSTLGFVSEAHALALSVDEFAALCAEREAMPNRRRIIELRYEINNDACRAAVERFFELRFGQDPSMRSDWQQAYFRYTALLRKLNTPPHQ